MQAGMNSAGVNEVSICHLVNSAHSLVPRMGDNRKYERIINCNKAIHGVINDLSDAVGHSLPAILLKLLPKAAGKSTKPGGIN